MGNDWLAAYEALGKHQFSERITVTITFFKLIDSAVAYICGTEKKLAFQKLAAKSAAVEELPAVSLYEIKNLEIFTDLN